MFLLEVFSTTRLLLLRCPIKNIAQIFLGGLSWAITILLFTDTFAASIYVDSKNGYITLKYPDQWTVEEYVDSRTKVAFHNPEDFSNLIRVIVQTEPDITAESLRQRIIENCQYMRSKGVKCTIRKEMIGSRHIYMLHLDYGGGVLPSENAIFNENGLSVSVGYEAYEKRDYEKNRHQFLDTLSSIVIMTNISEIDPKTAESEAVDKARRLVELLVHLSPSEVISFAVKNEIICDSFREALKYEPQDIKIQEVWRKVECD